MASWIMSEEQGRPIIDQAKELGINSYDTADMYSVGVSEEILGRTIKETGADVINGSSQLKYFFQ